MNGTEMAQKLYTGKKVQVVIGAVVLFSTKGTRAGTELRHEETQADGVSAGLTAAGLSHEISQKQRTQ
jgi:hypothetical protein